MYNIFQQPWLLLALSFVLLVIVYIIRTSFPEKQKSWHLILPVLIIVLALGLDYLVKTDHEKVQTTLEDIVTATLNRDVNTIDKLIAEDYSDRHHPNKQSIMELCKIVVKIHNIKSMTITSQDITVEGKKANAEMLVRLRMHDSNSAIPAPEWNYAKVKLFLNKQPDKSWQIKSTELVEVNKQPVSWKRAY